MTPRSSTNDSDSHGGAPNEGNTPLTAAVATGVLHGTLHLASDGTFTYVPDADFNGTDSFTYTATDAKSGESLEATVTIHVTSVNDVPVAGNDTASVAEDGHLNGTSVLANDSDLHGGAPSENNTPLTAVLGTTTTHGTLVLAADGTYTYDPAPDYNGTDSFTYRAKDSLNGLSALATVTITVDSVNDAPVATADSGTVAEDGTLHGTSVLGNDSDSHGGAPNENNTPLSAALGTDVAHGTLVLAADGTYTYTPAANYNGPDSFTYKAKDSIGDLGNEVTVSITVTEVNDTPVAVGDSINVNEDDSRTFDVRTNDNAGPNESGQTLTATVLTNPTHGDVVENLNGTFTYTPNANYNGLDGFTYKLCDNGTTDGLADPLCTTVGATVDVQVDSVNDAPSGTDKTITILEDGSHTFAPADFGFSDTDGNAFLSVQITSLPAAGTLTFDGSPAALPLVVDVGDIHKLVFTPAADANGLGYASFDFQVRDDGGIANGGIDVDPSANTITFDVTSVSDAPAGANATITTNEDTANVFVAADFGFSDPKDAPADTFTGIKVTNLSGNGSLQLDGAAVGDGDTIAIGDIVAGKLAYIPAANDNGSAVFSFDFQVQDDGSLADGGANLDPTPNSITMDVLSVNDVPSFAVGSDQTVDEDSGAATVTGFATSISTGPSDESGQTVAFTVTNDDNALFSGQPAIAPNGTLTFTPAANANGAATVTVSVKDNGGTANGGVDTSATQTFTITVRSVNDAPSGADNTVQTDESTPYVFTADDFGFNDPDGNDFAAVKVTTLPGDGELSFDGGVISAGDVIAKVSIDEGLLVFTPDTGAFGEPYTTFTFQVQDDGGTAHGGADLDPSANTMSINVGSINDAPTGTDGTVTIAEDGSHTFAVGDFGFVDTDGNAFLAVKITSIAGFGSLKLDGVAVTTGDVIAVTDITAAKLVFTPAANAYGLGYATIGFAVQDDGGTDNGGHDVDPTPNTLGVTVTTVNDAPNAVADTWTLPEDGSVMGDVRGNDDAGPNESGQQLTATILGQPAHGAAVDNGDGTFTYTPAANYHGSDQFTYQLCDDGTTAGNPDPLCVSTGVVNITVTSVNDAPSGTDKTVTILEDGIHTFVAADFGFSDSDGNALQNVKITSLPASGSLTLLGNPVAVDTLISAGSLGDLVFTPAPNANGATYASFQFAVQDDGGTADGGVDLDPSANTITIDVTAVNDVPSFTKGFEPPGQRGRPRGHRARLGDRHQCRPVERVRPGGRLHRQRRRHEPVQQPAGGLADRRPDLHARRERAWPGDHHGLHP